jgi:hypothetical protein
MRIEGNTMRLRWPQREGELNCFCAVLKDGRKEHWFFSECVPVPAGARLEFDLLNGRLTIEGEYVATARRGFNFDVGWDWTRAQAVAGMA